MHLQQKVSKLSNSANWISVTCKLLVQNNINNDFFSKPLMSIFLGEIVSMVHILQFKDNTTNYCK